MNIIEVIFIFIFIFVVIIIDSLGKEKLAMNLELIIYGYLFARLFYTVANRINSML